MDPISVSVVIDRPRADVYEYLLDIGNHAEFTDHFLKDFRLTRVESYGQGASARFRIDTPGKDRWADTSITEAISDTLIQEKGFTGKGNRTTTTGEYRLGEAGQGMTRVEFISSSGSVRVVDRLGEHLLRGWLRRKNQHALERLRDILEEHGGARRGERPTVGGLDRNYVENP